MNGPSTGFSEWGWPGWRAGAVIPNTVPASLALAELGLRENRTRTLPDGWVRTTLGEACEVNPRMTRPAEFSDEMAVSFVPMAAVDDVTGAIVNAETRPIGEVWRGYKRFTENDVIFAKITPCMENGKCAIAKGLLNGIGLGSTEFHVLRSTGVVTSAWVHHFVRQKSFRADAAAEMTGAVGQQRVPTRFMRMTLIPLAPLPEQHRIVAEIETQFTRLDAGVAALKRAQANLRRYRASVLKAACEGRLVPTEAELARAEEREYEPADVLLQRILAERRTKWEAENPGKKYKEPAAPDTSELPELPEGWVWANMLTLTVKGPQNGLYLPKSAYGAGTPILRIDDFQDGMSRASTELRCVSASSKDIDKYGLEEGDLVINRVNSPSHLGKSLVVERRNLPSLFESNMMRLRIAEIVGAHFIELYLRSPLGRPQLTKNAKWAVNQASINQKDVGNTTVPLPPLVEQLRIVAEVERRLSLVGELEKQVELALRRAGRLRQAILKHAFEGKLVPQDPNDEPASALLARIRA